MPFGLLVDWTGQENSLQTCSYININYPKYQAKGSKDEKVPKQNIQELWDNYNSCNICAVGIPKEEERKTSNHRSGKLREHYIGKFQKINTQTYCIKTAENQRQKNLGESKRK